MTISKTDLNNVQTDPLVAVSLMLNALETANGDVMEVDPSNPFIFTMETIAFNYATLRDEVNTKHARIHSKLANSESDLYNNMSYLDFKNIFSQPADAVIRFSVNVTNFVNNAILSPNNDYKMVSIPEGSIVSVEGYEFLISNRIDIKQFNNGVFSIEQNVSKSKIGVSYLGVIPHQIIKSSDENLMLIFDTVLKQVSNINNEYTIKKADSFTTTIDITDKLYFISASVKTSAGTTDVLVSYSEIIDPSAPTIIVKALSNSVEITVPDIYIINDMIVGKLYVSIYTTKGEVDYPLNSLSSNSFTIKFNNTTEDEYTSIIGKIAMANTALDRLTGGINGKTFSDLREAIINNSMGDSDTPITSKQLTGVLSNDGFYGYLLEDTVTDRTYIASRSLVPVIEANLLNANPDILFYKTKIIPNNFVTHPMIITSNDSDDRLIIKPNTIFKSVSGGVVPLSIAEINNLNSMSITDRLNYINNTKLLISPYSYISSIYNGVYYLRVVDYTAKINSFSIGVINSTVLTRINIQSYAVTVTDIGYTIKFKMITNSQFENLDVTTIRAQLKLPIDDVNSILYQATYNDGYFEFNINTDYYVSKDMELNITNGISNLATKYIGLNTNAELTTYMLGAGVEVNNDMYLNNSVFSSENVVVFTTESIDITFGTAIDKLYKNMTISYTDRKYLTYDEIIYATYDKDIYDTDSIGSLLTPINNNTEVVYTKLHSVGDPILDVEGNPIIKHNIGDYILDINNEPIIDVANGIIKYIDMLVLEYNYKYTNPTKIIDILDSIKAYMQDIKEYDSVVLEETSIMFKPFRSNDGVKIKYNNTYKTIYHDLKPEVTLYVEKLISPSESDLVKYKNTIGAVLHSYLNKDSFYTVDIRDEIKSMLPIDLVTVGIKLDTTDVFLKEAEKVVLHDNTNRLSLAKYVTNILGGSNLVYDIKITIVKI
jgi:hypothetical protein